MHRCNSFSCHGSAAQRGGSTSTSSSSGSASRTIGRDSSPHNPENSLEIIKPPAAAEEKAYKAFQKFQAMSNEHLAKKIQAGEDFLKKYLSTRYPTPAYSFLTVAYMQTDAFDKGLTAGEKICGLNPWDFRTMAAMSQAISRTVTATTPDSRLSLLKLIPMARTLFKVLRRWPSRKGCPMRNFTELKKTDSGSLELVQVHKTAFEVAIPELQQAVALGSNEDPTNYFVLEVANQNAGYFEKAVVHLKNAPQ
jgi:hypothetical protein